MGVGNGLGGGKMPCGLAGTAQEWTLHLPGCTSEKSEVLWPTSAVGGLQMLEVTVALPYTPRLLQSAFWSSQYEQLCSPRSGNGVIRLMGVKGRLAMELVWKTARYIQRKQLAVEDLCPEANSFSLIHLLQAQITSLICPLHCGTWVFGCSEQGEGQ